MAAYFDHQVQTPQDGVYKHEHFDWHSKFSLLALASYNEATGGEVNIFFEEGEKTRDTPLRKAIHKVSHVRWHPSKKILAIGWSNGDVTIWNQIDKGEIFSITPSPANDIHCLEWSSEGSRLIIADATGMVYVYKTDHRGCPQSIPFSKNKLKEPIVCCVLRPPLNLSAIEQQKPPTQPKRRQSIDAMGEDVEDALDDFGMKRSAGNLSQLVAASGKVKVMSNESWTFFLGGATGGVYCLLGSGVAEECFTVDRGIIRLLYYKEKDVLLTISEDAMLSQHKVSDDNSLQEIAKVKLSGKAQNLQMIWLEPGILAMSCMESHIRIWDLDNEDNCILSLSIERGYASSDLITCIAYCVHRSIIAAGTNLGNIAMWRPNKVTGVALDERWKLQLPFTLQNPVAKLKWAPSASILAVSTTSEVFTLKEQFMCTHMKNGFIAIQTGQKMITLTKIDQLVSTEYKPDIAIKGLFISQQNLCCWDGQKVSVYECADSGAGALIGSFSCTSTIVALFGQSLYTAEVGKIQVRTFQGTVKQTLLLADEENDPCCLDVAGSYLAVATTSGFLRIYDLSRREAKQQHHPKYVSENIKDFGSIISIRLNTIGNRLVFTVKKSDGSMDSKMYVWEAESDAILFYDFESGRSDQDEYEQAEVDPRSGRSNTRISNSLTGRQPSIVCWDSNDPRLLFCESILTSSSKTQSPNKVISGNEAETMVASFFVTSEHGILLQDAFEMSMVCEKLLGVEMPYIYFTRKSEFVGDTSAYDDIPSTEKTISHFVIRRTCRDFVGLESADKTTKDAMLNFSFYVTIGNMDEAFKAIKLIKSESVWENMAQMCVKTQRLDVAAVCLGNMSNVRAARMLRKANNQQMDNEAKVGCLAVQLGMQEDAMRLFQSCKRYDLINRLEQASNNWKKAIEIGEKADRVHLRNTYYNYAKHLEAVGAIQGAIEYYEKSDTNKFEVPRMLFENPIVLEQYVKKNKDPYIQRWWAQYLESLGEMEAAKNYYSAAKDYLSVIRLLCYLGDNEQASKIANDSNDKAACYHLARQYENSGEYKQAVHFFTKARAYGSAIRLCKEHGMDDKIAHLALMSSPADMIEAAKFYEHKRGHADKAVMLYHKAKMVARALDLAFRTEQFSALDLIAAELDASADPLVLERCAEFFMQNQQYTKAVQLLAYAKKHGEAIEICIRRNVPITEQLAELLTPTKDTVPDNVKRCKLLEQLADCCMQQGQYHYAAKKYTQAGSKIQAMRALLKSGDTEKIIFFANTARTKEIYIMAGNYLQTLDWKQDPEIMKHIVTFYSKGQAPESLASFYDACAQIEIDDYRDYEKALTALQEAAASLARGQSGKDTLQIEQKTAEINRKIALIKQFLGIRETYESDPVEAMKHLQELAEVKNVNDAVRLGDIYAVLIIHNVKKENYKKAHGYFEELRKRMPKLDVYRHLKPQVVERIYKQLNLPVPKLKSSENESQQNGFDNEYVPEASSLRRKLDSEENGINNNENE